MDDRQDQSNDTDMTIESIDRRAEDIARDEKEAGRTDTGPLGPSGRPTGTSSARDYTGIDPQDPKDGGSPAG